MNSVLSAIQKHYLLLIIVLVIIIVIAVLIATIYFALTCTSVLGDLSDYDIAQSKNPSIDYLISSLGNQPVPERFLWISDRILERQNEQEMIDKLRVATYSDNEDQSALANLILFRMRDEPERRLGLYVQAIQNGSYEESSGLALLLNRYMDSDDIEYLGQLEVLRSSDNKIVADFIDRIMRRLSSESEE